jgi:transposase-like protein
MPKCPICESSNTAPHPEKDQWRECLNCEAKWNTELIRVLIDK